MAPGASSNNDGIREFYAPRITEPPKNPQKQLMPRVEHQTRPAPIQLHTLHGSANRTKAADDDRTEAGCWGETKNYKAGDEFVLLWKWVDDFMDKRRAKNNSSKSLNVNKSTSQKPAPSSSREAYRAPKPAVTPSSEAVRRQATNREDMREYKAQRHTLWGEMLFLYQTWKDQQAKKRAYQARHRRTEEIARNEARSTNRREPPRATQSPPDQDHAADPLAGAAKKPVPGYNKKRGEVQKHTVKIAQLPPVHNSVHLEHTPSNNYRTVPAPARGQKNKSTRDTRFSDFLHRNVLPSQKPTASRDTQWNHATPGEADELVRNSRYSSVLDPAKAIKKAKEAKEAQEAEDPSCYLCGSSNCPGGYRDNITNLWLCQPCKVKKNMVPVQCTLCGVPNSPGTEYARNGLWMCTACRSPTTPKELPPSPKLSRKATSKPNCECDTPCPRIETFDDEKKFSICPDCDKQLTPFPVMPHKSHSLVSLASEGVPISEYNSEHLYSDDSYETRATTPAPQRPVGLGITLPDSQEEEEEEFRPTPPLKDSKYYQDSPTLPPMDYSQSYLRQPGLKYPYAPSPVPTPRKASVSFTHDLPRPSTSSATSKKQHHQQNQSFNPTTYPYPSTPSIPEPLHKPRPASSVYPTDEPATVDFPYPPPPIPQEFANRPTRSSSFAPNMRSRAALARGTEPVSLRSLSSSSMSAESGRAAFNRRSSWYDFWKPVFDKTGERSP